MKLREAKNLINKALTELNGFETVINADSEYLALGVKIGSVTAEEAAKKIMKSNSDACSVAELLK